MKTHQFRYVLFLLALTLFGVTIVVVYSEEDTAQSNGEQNSSGQSLREIDPFGNSEHRNQKQEEQSSGSEPSPDAITSAVEKSIPNLHHDCWGIHCFGDLPLQFSLSYGG